MKFLRKLTVIIVAAVLLSAGALLSADAANKFPTAYINTSQVNIRSGAGINYGVIANYPKKTKVKLLNGMLYNNDWYRIKLPDGQKGYIHQDYLTINNNQLYIAAANKGWAGYSFKLKNFVNTTGAEPKWTSSNKKIAIVKDGEITCLKAGTATITVKAGEKSVSSELTVEKAAVTLSADELEMFNDDDPVALNATCVKPVTFKSSDTMVASVSSSGKVTPVGPGVAKITAKSNSGSASCVVTVIKREIHLDVTKSTIYVGCYSHLTATGGKTGYSFKSSDTGILTVDSGGYIKGVSAGKAKITVTSGNLTKTKTFTVKSGTNVNLSHTEGTVNADMTYYVKSTTDGVKWGTSDKSVATVDGGFVKGIKKGKAIIYAYTSTGEKDFVINVKSAEAVRFAYTSENCVLLGKEVTLYAITDAKRKAVKFRLTDSDEVSTWVKNAKCEIQDGRCIWSASTVMNKAGVYKLEAYSQGKTSGNWSTSNGGKSTFMVSSVTSRKTTTYDAKRATTSIIKVIAEHEGFLSTVTPDELVYDAPTVGYGRVVFPGTTFYNGMTKTEAMAYLVKTVNDSGFTSRVNKLLTENKIKFNQYHFDALVCFSYNLGAYYIEDDDTIMSILKNTYGKESYKLTGYINGEGVALRKGPGTDKKLLKNLSAHTIVTLDSTKVYEDKWYKVTADDGTVGYVYKSYITRRTTDTAVRDLKNTSYAKFKKWILPIHHASGNCYWGLLYRRIDETELFFFGDYTLDGNENKYNMSYYCAYDPTFGIG